LKLSEKSRQALNLCLNTRCNYCRDTCSVYEISRMEFDSPRAKLELINEALSGRVDPRDIIITLNRCTTCKRCVESCPFGIDVADIIQEFNQLVRKSEFERDKRNFIIKTRYPQRYIENLIAKGNPFGIDSKYETPSKNIDFIFFPGCIASYKDEKIVNKARTIFDKLDLSYDTYTGCCYLPLKSFGFSRNEIQEFFRPKFDYSNKMKVVTLCGGCYNSLKEDHNQNVIHITSFLLDYTNKLNLKNDKKVTYVDSCKLGRYNKEYKEPRELLSKIRELQMSEIENNREDAPCCGGGGTLQYYFPEISTEISHRLLDQKAPDTTLVTACSYCKYHLTQNSNEKVKHIIDLIFESMS